MVRLGSPSRPVLLVLRDVCGLGSERAGEVGEWAVRTLIRGALAEATGGAAASG